MNNIKGVKSENALSKNRSRNEFRKQINVRFTTGHFFNGNKTNRTTPPIYSSSIKAFTHIYIE